MTVSELRRLADQVTEPDVRGMPHDEAYVALTAWDRANDAFNVALRNSLSALLACAEALEAALERDVYVGDTDNLYRLVVSGETLRGMRAALAALDGDTA